MAATLADFTTFADIEQPLDEQWVVMSRALQSLGPLFQSKIATGTEPLDVLAGLYLGIDGQSTTAKDWRVYVTSGNALSVDENTGTDASPVWVNRLLLGGGGGGTIPTHAASHQHGGADEVATATPGANAIVKASGSGLLATGWLTGVIRNAEVSASAAIAYSKLSLTGSIVNADVSASAAIAYSKLNLASAIVNADINASAAIALSKLATLTGSRTVGTTSGGVLTVIGGIREVLTAARTYYVRTDGSDSNTGLTNSSGGAFLTISKAISTVATLDLSTFAVTIQLGNTGTYSGANVGAPFVGGPASSVTLRGDPADPGSYVISTPINVSNNAVFMVSGVDFTSSSDGLFLASGATVTISGACHFGACTSRQMVVTGKSTLNLIAVCTANGNATHWLLAVENSVVNSNGIVHVWSGTPAYSGQTVQCSTGSTVTIVNGTPSGAATGTRYLVSLNGVINTNGGGASFIPGNVGGSAPSGGQYT